MAEPAGGGNRHALNLGKVRAPGAVRLSRGLVNGSFTNLVYHASELNRGVTMIVIAMLLAVGQPSTLVAQMDDQSWKMFARASIDNSGRRTGDNARTRRMRELARSIGQLGIDGEQARTSLVAGPSGM